MSENMSDRHSAINCASVFAQDKFTCLLCLEKTEYDTWKIQVFNILICVSFIVFLSFRNQREKLTDILGTRLEGAREVSGVSSKPCGT